MIATAPDAKETLLALEFAFSSISAAVVVVVAVFVAVEKVPAHANEIHSAKPEAEIGLVG